jgi:hypothetical protein
MTLGKQFSRMGRGLAIGAAVLAAVGLTTVPRPAHALSPGAGIGLGAFAAGTALGAAANPYYNPYYYDPKSGSWMIARWRRIGANHRDGDRNDECGGSPGG